MMMVMMMVMMICPTTVSWQDKRRHTEQENRYETAHEQSERAQDNQTK